MFSSASEKPGLLPFARGRQLLDPPHALGDVEAELSRADRPGGAATGDIGPGFAAPGLA